MGLIEVYGGYFENRIGEGVGQGAGQGESFSEDASEGVGRSKGISEGVDLDYDFLVDESDGTSLKGDQFMVDDLNVLVGNLEIDLDNKYSNFLINTNFLTDDEDKDDGDLVEGRKCNTPVPHRLERELGNGL